MTRKKFFAWFVDLRKQLFELINEQKYQEALFIINKALEGIEERNEEEKAYLLAEMAGFLIDISGESGDEKPVVKGLGIYKRNEELFKKYFWHGSYYYNLGNAYDTISKIKLVNKRLEYKPKNLWLLNQARNSLWKAYKCIPSHPENDFQPHFIVNLANTLDRSARVVESLQFYDLVIQNVPKFPKAHANRAEALTWLYQISGSSSFMLFHQIIQAYKIASDGKNLPGWMKSEFKRKASAFDQMLREHPDFENFDVDQEEKETINEYENHSEYRKYCLDNLLALSEHSLYCNCAGARRDDLMIATSGFPIQGEFIPIMEHYLNRMKSEFSTSRLLYYRAITGENEDWQVFQDEVVYTELFEGEMVNIDTEMLRTSYRLCFGILDKIGEAICELYDLAGKNENIYFHSFWNPRGRSRSKKQKERWDIINNIQNPSLLALYSQACDLNNRTGEWAFFKQWRNALEHGLFIITDDQSLDTDPFKIFDRKRKVVTTDYDNFEKQTLQLLRFTRSAIFNFVFCVRKEGGIKPESPRGPSLTLSHK